MRGLIIKKQADTFFVKILGDEFAKTENSKKTAKNSLKIEKKPQKKEKNDLKTENFSQIGEILPCVARKNLKKSGLFVGDFVEVDAQGAISKIEKRKNLLIRPPLVNLNKMFIVVAPVPKPDFYTVDKLIVFCLSSNIQPVLCINKSDLNAELCKKLKKFIKKL